MRITDCHVHVRGAANPDEVLRAMDKNGIERVVVLSRCSRTSLEESKQFLEETAKIAKSAPSRITPLAYVNPVLPGMDALTEKALSEMGYAGVKIIPDHWYAYEKRLEPFWERMNALSARILFHTGILYGYEDGSRFCRPCYLEKLLHYPNIKFAMAHISWPWCEECIAVMGRFLCAADWKREAWRSYIDITPGTPKHIRKQAIQNAMDFCGGADRLMFGTDACIPGDLEYQAAKLKEDLRLFEEIGLAESDVERIMSGTADKLFPAHA